MKRVLLAAALAMPVFQTSVAATLTFNGATTYQTIDGFGANINHRSWNNDDLKPVIDALVDQAGMTLFRIIYDKTDWEATNDNANASVMNWNYYNQIYSSPEFQKLWGLAAYLNQKGITNGVMFNFQGNGPAWLGSPALKTGMEAEWAEMVGSLFIYARQTNQLQFSVVGPDNEMDQAVQGVNMSASQYVTALHDLSQLLDTYGMSDLQFVGPDLAAGGTTYMPQMMADPVVMAKVAHFGVHSYADLGANSEGVDSYIQSSAYPSRNFWVTEYNVWCGPCDSGVMGTYDWTYCKGTAEYLMQHLLRNASAGLVWEGYDSQYNYYSPLEWSFWGLFGVDNPNAAVKTYTARKNFYTLAQLSKFVRPGAQRIAVSGSASSISPLLAFKHSALGQVTIVGINTSSSATTLSGALASLPTVPHLDLYYTSASANLAAAGSVAVNNGAFSATIPADCVFTLTGFSGVNVALTGPVNGAQFIAPATIPLAATATSGAGNIALVWFYNGATPLGEATSAPFQFTWNNVPVGNYALTAVAGDTLGNVATSAVVNVTVTGPLTQIGVTPANATVAPGATLQFTATGIYSGSSTQNITSQVTWTSSSAGVATINASGLAAAVAPGTTTISAALNGVSGSTTLTVQAAPLTISTSSLANGVVNAGYSATLTASGGTLPYTWSIASGSLPSGLTLNASSGAITGTPSVAGTFNFNAQVSDASSPVQRATQALSITVASVQSVATIWPTTVVPGLVDGGPDSAVELGVKFRSDVVGNVTGIRFYKATANTGTHVGNLWTGSGTLLATATFTGESASGWQQMLFAAPVAITSNTVYVASYHCTAGHYSADVNYFASKGVDNPPLHALMNGVSGADGVYAYGTSSAFPNLTWSTANYWVDVAFQPAGTTTLTSIALIPTNPSILTGASQQFAATGTYSDNSTRNLTTQVTWGSSNTGVASVTTGGLATGITAGATTVSAALAGVTGSTVLTVTAPATLTSIAVTPANPTNRVGTTQQFTATGTYSDSSTQNLTSQATWASSATAVASISSSGLATGAAAGRTTISAALAGVTGSTVLTVTAPATLTSIAVTPANPTNRVGTTQQFTATGTYSDSSTQNLTSQATWASSATAVASINSSGLATGAAAGSTTISAALAGVTGSTVLTVTAPATLTSIAVTPANPTNRVGTTQQFTAMGTYSDSSTQNLTSQATWASSVTAVASINSSGLATGAAAGSTTISATLGSVSGNTKLTIQSAPLAITTTSLPSGTVSTAYTTTLAASGGITPYAWSLASGAVPAGLALNSTGVITGTPTTTGTSSFTVRVADASVPVQTATGMLSLTINSAATGGLMGNTNEGTLKDTMWDGGAWINAGRFQAASNMVVSMMRAKVGAVPGKYKCAIYSDSSSLPSRLLGSTSEVSNPASGWQSFALTSSVTLTKGTYYWLAIWSTDVNAQVYYSGNNGTLRWGLYNYGTWPDPVSTTGGSSLNYCIYATQ